ncbi:integral membrane protein [Seiridium cupressi]
MTSGLPAESTTLAPLPGDLRDGLIAVTILAFLSFVSTALLVFYITYRLIKWELVARQAPHQRIEELSNRQADSDGSNDLSLGLEERHYHYLKTNPGSPPASEPPTPRLEKGSPPVEKKDTRWNPVLMLIYNLLCANLIEAMAFLLTVVWLKDDGIFVPTAICWAQGWFMQVGKLVCSGMLVLINPIPLGVPHSWDVKVLAVVWIVAFGFPLGSILGTHNGVEHGGFYARAGAWCWVNSAYSPFSLWLEYFWIFLAMAVTVFLLVFVLVSLYRNNQSARHFPLSLAESMERRQRNEPPKPSGHHPAFLVYQIIYIICTAPLASSRMAAMTGIKSGWAFYGFAGAMIASHVFLLFDCCRLWWLNVLLWSTTIIFIGDKDIQETGLEKFAFVRTPPQRLYGNVVLVQGGNETDNRKHSWRPSRRLRSGPVPNATPQHHIRHGSEESLRRSRSLENSAIEVEIEATVVIENVDESPSEKKVADGHDKEIRR